MNAQTNLPAERREPTQIEVLKGVVARRSDEFKAVLPAHISVEKFQRTIATAALANPKLFECDRQSLLMASMKAAQDGLLPDGREAALVPFKTRKKDGQGWYDNWEVQYLPMVYGLRKKVLQSGEVISIETGVVYKAEADAGHFIYEIGMDPPIRYRPKLDLSQEETGDDQIVVAFSIARLKNPNGGEPYWSVEVLRRFEIDKIRQMSQTGAVGRTDRQGKAIAPKGPWVDWFAAMAEKTALRQHTKALPMSGDLLDTLMRDDEEERRAQGAARLLETEPEPVKRLPTSDELDAQAEDGEQIDHETGEVTQRDARGMTEVDEDTARQLDAGGGNDGTLSDENPTAAEGPADEQRGEAHAEEEPEADYRSPLKPENAERGQTWFNTSDRKLRYAHQTPHGVKWYMEPQKDEAAEQGAADPGASAQASDEPPYLAGIRTLRTKLKDAKTVKAVEGIDRDWCNVLRNQVEDADPDLCASVDGDITRRKREIKQAGEG